MRKIAIPTRGGVVDDHFGHCEYYTVYTLNEDGSVADKQRLDSPQGCGCKSNIASTLQKMGVEVMLAGNMGDGAYNKLQAHNISVIRGCKGVIEDVLLAYLSGQIADSGNECHHECHDHGAEQPTFVVDFSRLKK